jgi:hypothetical protein
LYHACAVAWVLARVGLDHATSAEVRAEVCPTRIVGASATERWLAPCRWIEARRTGHLFARLGRPSATASRRQIAERTAMQLIALSASKAVGTPAPHAAWHGAPLVA